MTVAQALAGIDDPNEIAEKLKSEEWTRAFDPLDVASARKTFEDAMIPILEKALNRDSIFDGKEKTQLEDRELRAKVWEEATLREHLLNAEAALARGFTTTFLGTVAGASSLAEKAGIPAKGITDWAESWKKEFADQLPSDPRNHWGTTAVVSGAGEAPAQLATAFSTIVNAAANLSQVYSEQNTRFKQAALNEAFKEDSRLGKTKDSLEEWSLKLEGDRKDALTGLASWKALGVAIPLAASETLAEKFLLSSVPWSKIPGGKQLKEATSSFLGEKSLPWGAKIFADKAGRTGVAGIQEGAQEMGSNLGVSSLTSEDVPLTKGVAEATVAGLAGATSMSSIHGAAQVGKKEAVATPSLNLEASPKVKAGIHDFLTEESPQALSDQLKDLRSLPLSELVPTCLESLGWPGRPAKPEIAQAAMASAQLVQETSSLDEPKYHNRSHTADVVLAYTKLARGHLESDFGSTQAEQIESRQLGLIAAILHDLGHPGGNNTKPLELEENSVELARKSGCLDSLNPAQQEKVAKHILDTGFTERAEAVKKEYLEGGNPTSAILRHADVFRSVYINKDSALESGKLLKEEFMGARDRCPGLRADWVDTLHTHKAQFGFNAMNAAYIQSPAAKEAEGRRLSAAEELKEDRLAKVDTIASLAGPEKVGAAVLANTAPLAPLEKAEKAYAKTRDEVIGQTVQEIVRPTNEALMGYLEDHASEIRHHRKFAKVRAHQSEGGEMVQTKLDGRNETEVRETKPGDWVVSNIASQGEAQIVDDKTFRKRYDTSNPKDNIYSPKGADFHGVVYDGSLGENITFAPPNWGGATMNISKGYMIGGPDPKNLGADFYGIDPEAFAKTYKPVGKKKRQDIAEEEPMMR
jgi:hypothetical protein